MAAAVITAASLPWVRGYTPALGGNLAVSSRLGKLTPHTPPLTLSDLGSNDWRWVLVGLGVVIGLSAVGLTVQRRTGWGLLVGGLGVVIVSLAIYRGHAYPVGDFGSGVAVATIGGLVSAVTGRLAILGEPACDSAGLENETSISRVSETTGHAL